LPGRQKFQYVAAINFPIQQVLGTIQLVLISDGHGFAHYRRPKCFPVEQVSLLSADVQDEQIQPSKAVLITLPSVFNNPSGRNQPAGRQEEASGEANVQLGQEAVRVAKVRCQSTDDDCLIPRRR
jgi:hypothetical protein